MYPLSIVSLILALIAGGVMFSSQTRMSEMRDLHSQAVASNLTVYSGFVSAYVSANPSVSGPVSDGSLNLPGWFFKHPHVRAFRQGTTTFVYVTDLPHWQLESLVAHYASSDPFDARYGINRSGSLRLPGNQSFQVPGQVPNGAFVVAL